MPSNRPIGRTNDVIRDIDSIREYTTGFYLDGYMKGPQMMRDAVEICFQRISEETCKPGRYLDRFHSNSGWRGARGSGNIFVTDYDQIDNPKIYFTIIQDPPKLHEAAIAGLARLSETKPD